MSATVGMFATVGNVRNCGGNVCNSGEIEHGLVNLGIDISIHNYV